MYSGLLAVPGVPGVLGMGGGGPTDIRCVRCAVAPELRVLLFCAVVSGLAAHAMPCHAIILRILPVARFSGALVVGVHPIPTCGTPLGHPIFFGVCIAGKREPTGTHKGLR